MEHTLCLSHSIRHLLKTLFPDHVDHGKVSLANKPTTDNTRWVIIPLSVVSAQWEEIFLLKILSLPQEKKGLEVKCLLCYMTRLGRIRLTISTTVSIRSSR